MGDRDYHNHDHHNHTTTPEGQTPGGINKFMTQNAGNGCIPGYAPRLMSYERCEAGIKDEWTSQKYYTWNYLDNRQEPQCANDDWPSAGCFAYKNRLYFSTCPEGKNGNYDR